MQRSAYQQLADVLSPNITGIKGCILETSYADIIHTCDNYFSAGIILLDQ